MRKRWAEFWFSTSSRYSLGFFRVLFIGWLAVEYIEFVPTVPKLAFRPEEFFFPCAALRWIGLQEWPGAWLPGLGSAAWVLLATAGFGLATRFSLILLAVLNFLLRGFHNSWVYVGHASIIPALVLLTLAVSPGIRSWSFDAVIEWFRMRRTGQSRSFWEALTGGPVAVWPIHLTLALLALVYLASGLAKIGYAGSSWLSGRTLQFYLSGRSYEKRFHVPVQFFSADPEAPADVRFRDPWGLQRVMNLGRDLPFARRIGRSQAACAALAWATVIVECTFVLVFFLPRWGQYLLLASMTAFHIAIGQMMRIDFSGYMICYLVLIDWNALIGRMGEFLPGCLPAPPRQAGGQAG